MRMGVRPVIKAIHQLLPNFNKHDAIGNEAVIMQRILREMGFSSEIYAEFGGASELGAFLERQEAQAAVLYHFSIASSIPSLIAPLPMLKLVRYHNITPPWFFRGDREQAARHACSIGRRQIAMVGTIADSVAADSQYNASEMIDFTDRPPVVVPILRDYSKLASEVASEYAAPLQRSGRRAMLFVGRIAPNKCQHDLIVLLHLAQKFIDKNLQLILVGSFFSEEFADQIAQLCSKLGLKLGTKLDTEYDADVLIPRNVSDQQVAALYRHSTVFVSMSEHEGFGVPLVEAMHFDLPLLAHKAAAVPETIGDAGILVDKDDWPQTLAALRALLESKDLRDRVVGEARLRRQALGLKAGERMFKDWIESSVARC